MTIFVIVGVVIIYSFLPRILSNFPRAKLGSAVFADVTSANVVGYNVNNPTNFIFVGSSFMNMGNNPDMTYGELAVNCDELDPESMTGWVANQDSIVVLDEGGSFKRKLVYIPNCIAEGVLPYGKGWYDPTDLESEIFDNCYNTTKLPFGQGIQVCIENKNLTAKMTFSGEVKKTPTITPVAGFMTLSNCSPKPIKIKDVKVNCNEEDPESMTGWVANADAIVVLDEGGSFKRKLVYIPNCIAEGVLPYGKGWYDPTDLELEIFDNCYNDKVTYAPGDGFQVCIENNAGATVQIDPAITE